jgi:hypothetical protein
MFSPGFHAGEKSALLASSGIPSLAPPLQVEIVPIADLI